MSVEQGLQAVLDFEVTEAGTAAAVGSGDLPVLGTPQLLAWFEATTCAAIADRLTPEQSSVGSRISVEHRAASPVGAVVQVTAAVSHVDGRLVRFTVAAAHADGSVVGTGEVTRVVVDRTRFLDRVRPAGA